MRWKSMIKSKKGMTLVELIVSFALIGIFMTAATVVLSASMRVYVRANNFAHAQTVADMLLETITGELSSAADAPFQGSNDSDPQKYCMKVDGTSISFVDKNAYPVIMKLTDGRLQLEYQKVKNSNTTVEDPVTWQYDEGTYLNTSIKSLEYSRIKDNLIKVDLTLTASRGNQDYEFSRVVECYNLTQDKIKGAASGGGSTSGGSTGTGEGGGATGGEGTGGTGGTGEEAGGTSGEGENESETGSTTGGDGSGSQTGGGSGTGSTPGGSTKPTDGTYIEIAINGETHYIIETTSWGELKEVAINAMNQASNPDYTAQSIWLPIKKGTTLISGSGADAKAYVMIWEGAPVYRSDTSVADMVSHQPGAYVCITGKVYTSKEIKNYFDNNGNVATFDPNNCPKAGDLFYDGTNYYVGLSGVGPYETNIQSSGCWLKLNQPSQEVMPLTTE